MVGTKIITFVVSFLLLIAVGTAIDVILHSLEANAGDLGKLVITVAGLVLPGPADAFGLVKDFLYALIPTALF